MIYHFQLKKIVHWQIVLNHFLQKKLLRMGINVKNVRRKKSVIKNFVLVDCRKI